MDSVPEHRVYIAGDWHGNTNWANGRLQQIGMKTGPALVLHVGDFGIWPGADGQRYLDSVDKMCDRYNIKIAVTPGNHEDWNQLDALWDSGKDEIRPNIRVLHRNQRFVIDDVQFLSLGGAPSIDRHLRTENRDWWPQEAITEWDVELLTDVILPTGPPVDVMLTHDSPDAPWQTPCVRRICETGPLSWPADSLAYAEQGRKLLSRAFEAVKPRLLVHGHYHEAGRTTVQLPGVNHLTELISLPRDGDRLNVLPLDLDEVFAHT